jgi:hypothetical protein
MIFYSSPWDLSNMKPLMKIISPFYFSQVFVIEMLKVPNTQTKFHIFFDLQERMGCELEPSALYLNLKYVD